MQAHVDAEVADERTETDHTAAEAELRLSSASSLVPMRDAHSRWVTEVAPSDCGLREEVAALAESVKREAETSQLEDNLLKCDSTSDAPAQPPKVTSSLWPDHLFVRSSRTALIIYPPPLSLDADLVTCSSWATWAWGTILTKLRHLLRQPLPLHQVSPSQLEGFSCLITSPVKWTR